jgi:hypothetical protein
MYENGGGAAAMLYWNTGSGITVVPSSALTTTAQFVFRSLLTYGTHTISVYGMGSSLVTAGGDATLNTNLYNAINSYMTNLV